MLLYALGQSLVGRQAAELQEVALDLKWRFGASPDVFTRGRMAVAAAHAFAVNKGLFGKVEFVNPPPSWTESVRKALDTPMAICVNGALLSYDWTELALGECLRPQFGMKTLWLIFRASLRENYGIIHYTVVESEMSAEEGRKVEDNAAIPWL